jgi:hypothetical protein
MTDWNAKDPETGEPVHVRMGLTEDCQGPADPPDPAFHHWGCWCGDRHCPGPPRWTDLFGIDPNYLKDAVEGPTLTTAEVKVLTETATRVAYALGRKDAGEEIYQLHKPLPHTPWCPECHVKTPCPTVEACWSMRSQPAGATSNALSGAPESSEVGSESQAVSNRLPQEPCGHPTCPCASQEDTNG